MFHNSTHKSHWIFSNISEVDETRKKCIEKYGTKCSIPANDLITVIEHKVLCKYYEKFLFHLCMKFQPPLPFSVLFTAFVYFKRIYLQTSVMEHLPKDMVSVCLYMACKVEEYNISVDKFVMIYPEMDRVRTAHVILGNEMELMKLLNYHLIVHSPKRALEGFFIDIKTRFQPKEDFDKCREVSNEFLNAVLFSDAVFLYTPSQIALAALFTSSKDIVHKYIVSILASGGQGKNLLKKIEGIIELINNKIICDDSHVKDVLEKLRRLQCPDESKAKKRKMGSVSDKVMIKRQKSSDSDDQGTATYDNDDN